MIILININKWNFHIKIIRLYCLIIFNFKRKFFLSLYYTKLDIYTKFSNKYFSRYFLANRYSLLISSGWVRLASVRCRLIISRTLWHSRWDETHQVFSNSLLHSVMQWSFAEILRGLVNFHSIFGTFQVSLYIIPSDLVDNESTSAEIF